MRGGTLSLSEIDAETHTHVSRGRNLFGAAGLLKQYTFTMTTLRVIPIS